MKLLWLLVLHSASGAAFACTPPLPDERLAREGRNVIIGKVVSPGFTQSRPDGMPEMLVKIERLEILSGRTPATVSAVSPCALPLQLGERVVVATFAGRRYVYPADMYEESFKQVHRRER